MFGSKKYLALILVLVLATIGTTQRSGLFRKPETTPLLIPFDQLPTEINGWRLVSDPNMELSEGELKFIQPDAYIRRAYRKGPDVVVLYIAYYGNRLEGGKRIHHNATVCMVASGYELKDVSEGGGNEVQIFSDVAKSIPLDHLYFVKDGTDYFVTQFFSLDGQLLKESPKPKSTPFSRLEERIESLNDAGFCFQVQVGHRPHGDVEKARDVHTRFLRDSVGTILKHFPAGSGH